MAHGQHLGLRTLLLGTPLLGDREDGEMNVAAGIDGHLLALVELLPKIYGDSEACRQAVLENERRVR